MAPKQRIDIVKNSIEKMSSGTDIFLENILNTSIQLIRNGFLQEWRSSRYPAMIRTPENLIFMEKKIED